MILIHIIRRKKKKIKTTTNFLPTHIKHNSSKIITIIITITYTIDSITWTFCTISFKLAIGSNISKEFLRLIGLFSVQFLEKLAIDPNISKEFLRSIGLFPVQFLEKLAIDPNISKEFLRSIGLFDLYNFLFFVEWKIAIDPNISKEFPKGRSILKVLTIFVKEALHYCL
jgi:hypothetical protein